LAAHESISHETAHDPDRGSQPGRVIGNPAGSFQDEFVCLFDMLFPRIFRYLDRLSGDPELAADLAQETFLRLYRRNDMPERPEAWLISVAINLFRNARASASRRGRLLSIVRGEGVHSESQSSPAELRDADESRQRVRAALQTLPERDQNLLLLRAEGFSYHDIANALMINESSVGTLLARAKSAFRETWEAANAS
jgi:RNA polymerase sigma-70 factor (ECF subfamily)